MAYQETEKHTYTNRLEDEMWNILSADYDDSVTLDFLNSDAFRSFGESLSSIIREKMINNGVASSPQKYLKQSASEKAITITSANTFTNWFKHDSRPKKTLENRETMFRIAFALDLDADETAELFHKAYLDRAFDFRRYQELVYYYCIVHHLSYHHAEKMIAMVDFEKTIQDNTIKTVALREESSHVESDAELIQFINEHPHNFNLGSSNVSGKEFLEALKAQAFECANQEVNRSGRTDEYRNRSRTSINFLYSVITDQPAHDTGGTKTSFKNALLPKEIKQCFPQPVIFSDDDPSYEELRKMLILLYSYQAWFHVQFDQEQIAYEEYVDDLNNILFEANLPPLYAGNPYDWLFMCCVIEEAPLDAFREILSKALGQYEE